MANIGHTGDREARLVASLRGALEWLEDTSIDPLFDALLGEHPRCRALFGHADHLDHIGFLLPPWAKPMVGRAATAAGFPSGHRAFPSALVARELGRVVGKRRVETQIFKAHGRGQRHELVAFEAFIPNAPDTDVEDWIRQGIVQHVAVDIAEPARFDLIRDTFRTDGIPMAQFMFDRAVYLPGEDATIMYFDLDHGMHPFRLEVRVRGENTPEPSD